MVTPLQSEIWWAEAQDKRRPVLVLTRNEAIPVLTWLTVAPVTRTEVTLGPDQGLVDRWVASFENLQPIRRSFLTDRVGRLGSEDSDEICRALRALADC